MKSRSLKILLVHNYYRLRGGEETYLQSLTTLLKSKGHKVALYSKDSRDIKTFKDRIKVGLGMFWNFDVVREFTALVKSFKPDVVQFQNIFPAISPTVYWVCRRQHIPMVQHVTNYRYLCPKGSLFRGDAICELCVTKNFYYPSIIYGCYDGSRIASFVSAASFFFHKHILSSFRLVDKFVFPSEFLAKYFIKHSAVDQKRSIVIPTLGPDKLPKGRTKSDDYYLFVGRLAAEKGIFSLLEEVSHRPEIKLTVVGQDERNAAGQKYGKYKNIRFMGELKKPEVLSLMSGARAVVIPSLWYDVLPNVLIESLSVATPVIAPAIGPFKSLIKNGENGFLYRYGKTEELYTLLKKFKKTDRIRRSTLESYRRKYQPADHYQRLMNIYGEVIKQNIRIL